MSSIVPAHRHSHTDPSVSTGRPSIKTLLGEIQGVTTAGMHGAGVGTPSAAAVRAMTAGLAGEWHRPKVGILTIGAKFINVATGRSLAKTPSGSTTRAEGARPMSQNMGVPRVATGPGMWRQYLQRSRSHSQWEQFGEFRDAGGLCAP